MSTRFRAFDGALDFGRERGDGKQPDAGDLRARMEARRAQAAQQEQGRGAGGDATQTIVAKPELFTTLGTRGRVAAEQRFERAAQPVKPSPFAKTPMGPPAPEVPSMAREKRRGLRL